MNDLQTQLRHLVSAGQGQMATGGAALLAGSGSPGGFADLLRNFDAAPPTEPTPSTPDAPPTPEAADKAEPDQQPQTQVLQKRAKPQAAESPAGSVEAAPDAPLATPTRAAQKPAEPTCTLTQSKEDGALESTDLEPALDAPVQGPRGRQASARRPETEAAQALPDANAAPPQLQAQSQAELQPSQGTVAAGGEMADASTDSARRPIDEARAQAHERLQGQQQADRQAQMLERQAAPLDATTHAAASPAAAAMQTFAAELQNSLPAGAAPRSGALAGLTGLGGATGAGLAARAGTTGPASAAATRLDIQESLDEAGFSSVLGARLAVLATQGVQKAELHLNPADMGPVAVQISVDGQQAQVTFHAAQAQTRSVLEQGLPDLAAALAANGLTLSGGGVFQQQSGRERQATAAQGISGDDAGPLAGTASGVSATAGQAVAARSRGVVDLYA